MSKSVGDLEGGREVGRSRGEAGLGERRNHDWLREGWREGGNIIILCGEARRVREEIGAHGLEGRRLE